MKVGRLRSVALYTYALTCAAILMVCVQYGWRPPFAATWDSIARLVTILACAVVASVSAWGLGSFVRLPQLPDRLRLVPAHAASAVVGGLCVAAARLSAASTLSEAVVTVALGAAAGLVLGLLIGFASDDSAGRDMQAAIEDQHWRLGWGIPIAMLLCVGFLLVPRAPINPELEVIGRFERDGSSLEIGTVTFLGERLAVIRIRNQGATNSLVLEKWEWKKTLELLAAGRQAQPGDWRVIGAVSDTVPTDRSRIRVSAGDGLRLALSSQHGPTVSYDFPASDFAQFDAVAAQVEQNFRPR